MEFIVESAFFCCYANEQFLSRVCERNPAINMISGRALESTDRLLYLAGCKPVPFVETKITGYIGNSVGKATFNILHHFPFKCINYI
jgi:hypothetical protein